MTWGKRSLAAALLAVLAGCATPPKDPAELAVFKANHDPLEPMNRRIFAFNQGVDKVVIKPVAEGYVHVFPGPVRDGLRHIVDNLGEPLVAVNNVLQWQWTRVRITVERFLVNSTAGIAGWNDVASKNRLPAQTGDFGQTLYAWGIRESAYLVVPVIGPTTFRDGVGMGADVFMDPMRYAFPSSNTYTIIEGGVGGIDERARNIDTLDALQKQAIDYYASFRSYYLQNRAAVLRHGAPAPPPPLPSDSFYSDPGQ